VNLPHPSIHDEQKWPVNFLLQPRCWAALQLGILAVLLQEPRAEEDGHAWQCGETRRKKAHPDRTTSGNQAGRQETIMVALPKQKGLPWFLKYLVYLDEQP
jgi:hypothetical protein